MKHPQTVAKVQKWIAARTPGDKFASRDIAKIVNLTSDDVGNILKWQENVRKAGKLRGTNTVIWERIAA